MRGRVSRLRSGQKNAAPLLRRVRRNRSRKRRADGLSEVMRVPVETTNLYRAIENPTQTKKSVYERCENTKGIFDIHDAQLFENKHILIVDDVLTTGSTLIACAEAVKAKCPSARISVFTLAAA